MWLCRCHCGVQKLVRGFTLTNCTTKSCGCMSRKMTVEKTTRHNRSKDKVYKVWSSMWSRCTNPNDVSYARYKDRTPPERWRLFENFIADMGERPSELHTLERVDNEKPYGPKNCVWATRSVQNNNRSANIRIEYNGVTKTLTQWADFRGMKAKTLSQRLTLLNWPLAEALNYMPHRHGNSKKGSE